MGIIGVVAFATGCGSRQPGAAESTPTPPLELEYPALSVVPADATYVVVGTTSAIARTLDEVQIPLSISPAPLYLTGLSRISQDVLGVDISNVDALVRAGIDIDRTLAVFSTGLLPTFALPVGDADNVAGLLDGYRSRAGVTVRDSGGVELAHWQPTEHLSITYAIVSDWLIVRFGDPARDAETAPDAWLAAMRTAMTSHAISADQAMVAAAADARDRVAGDGPLGALGVLRVARFGDAIAAAGGEVDRASACWRGIRRAVDRVVVGVRVDGDAAAHGVISIGLSAGAAAAARANTAAGPPAGYRAYRARAGLYADLGLDVGWLDQAVTTAGCPAIGGGLDRAAEALARFGGGSAHVAIEQLVVSKAKLKFAGYLGLANRNRFTRRVLDAVPGRSFVESTIQIGGRKAKAIDLGVVPRVVYAVDDAGALGAIGAGVATTVFGADGPPQRGVIMAAIGARPDRLVDMEQTLTSVLELTGIYDASSGARTVARLLSRYDHAEIAVELVVDTVEIRGRVKLAR